jgi:DNA helicase II / ATP-dependent DNA helicase PcrA
MTNLSHSQSVIVNTPIGQAIQVLASAGSGKTRILTERVRYLIENTRKDGIIALTFTNKAAEEVLSRLTDLDEIEDRCWIATIHTVAQRILEQYGHTIELPSELHIYERDQDRKVIFLQSLRESGIDIDDFLNVADEKVKKDRESVIQERLKQFSYVKRELLNEQEIEDKFRSNRKFLSIFKAYQNSLLESGGIDFDDILVYAHRILLKQPWCANIYNAKYKHICVDEAQDLNKAQYEFIKVLCGDKVKSILMVGDPNQMIYGFNGSSKNYLCVKFIEDFNPTKYILNENFRSSKAVIHLANKLRKNSQVESDCVLNGRSEIVELEDEADEANWICNKINSLLQEKNDPEIEHSISLDRMVVIARNQFVFQELEKQMKKHEFTYVLNKHDRYIEPASTFGKILDLAIRLRLNSKDWVDGKKLCSVLKISTPEIWGIEELLKKFAEKINKDNIIFPSIQSELLNSIQDLDLEKPNIPKFCNHFNLLIENLRSDISSDNEGELERSLQELQAFNKNWINFKRKGLGESLYAFRNATILGHVTDYESSLSGITLSTVHSIKGLEKDIVFLMGMCEGIFPDYRARSNQEIEEELNSAFVAVTRARRWIFITHPKYRTMPWGDTKLQRKSRFIQDL